MRMMALVLGVAMMVGPLQAAVVGMNVPVKPLTAERIEAELPKRQQAAWLAYLQRSAEQMVADKAVLAKERAGLAEVPGLPKQGSNGRAMKLHESTAYYKTEEARRMGEIVMSFQTPSGGWSKNLLMDAPRLKGQSYAAGNQAPASAAAAAQGRAGDFDAPKDEGWHYVGTLDNDATNTELHFLAELAAAWPGHDGDAFRASFLRGVEYLLQAQYPNGGWPQVWPLEGGYHDEVTFNDDAEVESAELLMRVGAGRAVEAEDYSFVPAGVRARAKAAVAKALGCVLRAQVRVHGTLTVWAQQYDPLTLQPASARNYEMPALSSGESASAMEYLMSLPKPNSEVKQSLAAAYAWFEANKIMGYTWSGGRDTPGGRHLEKQNGAGPLWARYYSLTTGKPIFGDRDKTIHDDVMEISMERRNGYAWYSGGEEKVLEEYRNARE